jgi:hypothetical protein
MYNECLCCSTVESPESLRLGPHSGDPLYLYLTNPLTCGDLRTLVDTKNNDAYMTLIRHKAHVNVPTDHASRDKRMTWETDLTTVTIV